MARINNLSNFLTDVATAIKNKKGSETPIPAANFDTEITNLPSQGVYQHKTATVAENGTITILPDTGYDAIDQLDITVNIPLQQKTYTFTQNTTTTIIPEQGYAGFSQVGLEINVPSSQINNQDKTVTQNGTYTADTGYTGLGTVIVNVPNNTPIKLYNSKEEMIADTTEPENEYGVVYSQQLQPIAEGMKISTIYVPSSFTLTEPVTSSIWLDMRSDDYSVDISLNGSGNNLSCYLRVPGSHNNIRWVSTDGLNFTLDSADDSSVLDTSLDLGTTLTCFSEFGDWPITANEIFKTGGMYFEGMYEWKNEKDNEWFDICTGFERNDSTKVISTTNVETYLPELTLFMDEFRHHVDYLRGIIVKSGDNYYWQEISGANRIYFDVSTNKYYIGGAWASTSSTPTYKIYSLDLENYTFTLLDTRNYEFAAPTTSSYRYYSAEIYSNGDIVYNYDTVESDVISFIKVEGSTTTNGYDTSNVYFGHIVFLTWHHVHTEFDLEFPHQLPEGVTALGKYGPVIGDGSIYDHLDLVSYITSKNDTFAPICADMNFTGKGLNIETLPTEHSISCGISIYNTLNLEGLSEAASYNGGCTGTQNYFLYWFNNDAPYNITIYNLKGEIVFEDNPFGFTDRPSGLRFAENPNNINDIIAMYGTKLCHINTNTGIYTEPIDIGMSCTELRYDINDNGRFYAIYIPYGSAGLKIYDSSTNSIYTYSCRFGYNDGANVYQDDDYVYTTASAGEKSGSSVGVRHCVYNKSTHQISILFEDSTNKMPLLYDMYNNNVYFHNTSNNKIYSVSGTTMTEFSSNTSGIAFNTYNCLCCVYNNKMFILYGNKLYDTATGTYMNIVTNYNRTTYNGIGVLDTAWTISSSAVKRFVFKPMYDIIANTSNNFILDFNSNNGGTFHDGIIIYNG